MSICENCGIEHDGSYGSGRFCSVKCSRGFSTKAKRKEINEKVSTKLKKFKPLINKTCPICKKKFLTVKNNKICCSSKCGAIYGGSIKKYNNGHFIDFICPVCNNKFLVPWNKRYKKYCSKVCRNKSNDYKELLSKKAKLVCNSAEAKIHMRDIGRKGGFGKRGITNNGNRYESLLEKQCFEWLEENSIKFEPHKYIPNSSKVSDIFLVDKNLWIELDGINREKKKEWLGKSYDYWINKLNIYKEHKLNYMIIYNLDELKHIMI